MDLHEATGVGDEQAATSRTSLGKRMAMVAQGVGGSLSRTVAAVGEVILDSELRSKSVARMAEAAVGVGRGLQHGAERIAAGPRTVQGILHKLQHRIEQQRMNLLLQDQQDTPVDVQVAFSLYEDGPQELRSRLWMAVLEHPELCTEYQTLAAALQKQQHQADQAAGRPGSSMSAQLQGQPEEGASGSGGDRVAEVVPMQGNASSSGASVVQGLQAQPTRGDGSAGAAPVGQGGGFHPAHDPAHLSGLRQDDDGWQFVNDQAAACRLQGQPLLAGAGKHMPYSREREGFRNSLMAAMSSVEWPLSSTYPADCRFATLLEISVGQEEVEEIISRDIHRTFPEHPLFAFEQGQQALYDVLKAYALHDMQVGYCQGMGFVAGLLLFYVPPEPAFQLFCRLMSTSGPNLRRFYLPGLEGLKAELRKLEFLLAQYLPNLAAHLHETGVVPVLFASQWLLTGYSCPFPVSFACRVVDLMVQENSDAILLKVAITILAECEGDLLMQEDFEALLTYLKVEPAQWPSQRLRRVLNAAICSPITAEDLEESQAALEQGYSSRGVTFSDETEASAPHGEPDDGASLPSTAPAGAGDDTVAAVYAAQQQIDEELMNMVLRLDLDWSAPGDEDAEESYSNTLHSAVHKDTGRQSL